MIARLRHFFIWQLTGRCSHSFCWPWQRKTYGVNRG